MVFDDPRAPPMSTPTPARLLLIFGGRSSEHEISVRSARELLHAIDTDRFSVELLGISRAGVMRRGASGDLLEEVIANGELVRSWDDVPADIVFPLLHGPYGEDGTIQGSLELGNVPYVGSGVAASAVCMDKIMLKHVARSVGIPVVSGVDLLEGDLEDGLESSIERILENVGSPCFVKPANQGSSIGISRVQDETSLRDALLHARSFDTRVVVERGLDVLELEVGVLGSGDAATVVSPPGQLKIPDGQWYDFENKYVSDVVETQVPADVDASLATTLREHALSIFRATGCHGLARVDFLVERETMRCYLNEVNTMPGFTSISMYPTLMAATGVRYPDLIARLCELGMERARRRRELSVTA